MAASIQVRIPFKGDYFSRAASIKGGFYSRAASIQGRLLFKGGFYLNSGFYSTAASFPVMLLFKGGFYSKVASIQVLLLLKS